MFWSVDEEVLHDKMIENDGSVKEKNNNNEHDGSVKERNNNNEHDNNLKQKILESSKIFDRCHSLEKTKSITNIQADSFDRSNSSFESWNQSNSSVTPIAQNLQVSQRRNSVSFKTEDDNESLISSLTPQDMQNVELRRSLTKLGVKFDLEILEVFEETELSSSSDWDKETNQFQDETFPDLTPKLQDETDEKCMKSTIRDSDDSDSESTIQKQQPEENGSTQQMDLEINSVGSTTDRLIENVDFSISGKYMDDDDIEKRRAHCTARRLYALAICIVLSFSTFLTIFFSLQDTDRSRYDDESKNSSVLQIQHADENSYYLSSVSNDPFETAHQVVLACIEESETAFRSCAELCASKRCCFDEFDCPTIRTKRECSVYAGCLSWLQEERYQHKEKQLDKDLDELLNETDTYQDATAIIWRDPKGYKVSADLVQEACAENNMNTQYGHDNCWYLCQQHGCCFNSSSQESCSDEQTRCQVFSPCEKLL